MPFPERGIWVYAAAARRRAKFQKKIPITVPCATWPAQAPGTTPQSPLQNAPPPAHRAPTPRAVPLASTCHLALRRPARAPSPAAATPRTDLQNPDTRLRALPSSASLPSATGGTPPRNALHLPPAPAPSRTTHPDTSGTLALPWAAQHPEARQHTTVSSAHEACAPAACASRCGSSLLAAP